MAIPQTGEIFENYKIIQPLGEGGMGTVLLAEDLKLHRKVALKFIETQGKTPSHSILKRFENEARILAALSTPYIVNIYTFGSYVGQQFLVMEYVEGCTLSEVIAKNSYGIDDSLKLIKSILLGLNEAHSKGVLHRDIKPANLLITKDGQLKIVDFGISHILNDEDDRITQADHFIGTISYMAPEILAGKVPTPTSDIYSVGLILYELLTGRNPYRGQNKLLTIEQKKTTDLTLPEELTKILSIEMITFFDSLVARDPEKRFPSVRDAIMVLGQIKISKLPDHHGVALPANAVIGNADKTRKTLLSRGFNNYEIRILTNMAAKIQEANLGWKDAITSEVINLETLSGEICQIEIGEDALEEAIDEFKELVGQFSPGLEKVEAQSEFSPYLSDSTKTQSKESTAPVKKQKARLNIQIPGPRSSKENFKLVNTEPVKRWMVKGAFLSATLLALFLIQKSINFKDIQSYQVVRQAQSLLKILEGSVKTETVKTETASQNKVKKSGQRKTASLEPFPLARPNVGSTYEYLVNKTDLTSGSSAGAYQEVVKIKGLQGDIAQILHYDGKKWIQMSKPLNIFSPPIQVKARNGSKVKNRFQGSLDGLFPLRVGAKAQMNYSTLLSSGQFVDFEKRCEVIGIDEVTVIANSLQVFSIKCRTTGPNIDKNTIYSFAPTLNQVVKVVENSKELNNNYQLTKTLTKISRDN